jgi:hypothetical protein
VTIGAAPPWLIIGLTFWRCRSHLAILPASRATGSSGLTFVDRLIVHDPRNHRARILIVVATSIAFTRRLLAATSGRKPVIAYIVIPKLGN